MASVAKREWTYKGAKKTAWVVRYMQGGKHRSRQFDLRKEADKFRQSVEAEIADGTHVARSDTTTVARMCDEYLQVQEDRFRDGRIGRSRLTEISDGIRLYVRPLLGDKVFLDIRPKDVTDFYSKLLRSGRLAPFTAKQRVKLFGAIAEFARRRGAFKSDFMREALEELRGIEHKVVRTPNLEEMRRLLEVVSTKYAKAARPNMMTRCYVCLAAFCGLRYGEIGALTLANVDFVNGVIRVRHSITEWDELKSPKTASGRRDVPMPTFVREMLQDWIATFYVPNDRQLVFRLRKGQYMCRNTFRTGNWHVALTKAGLLDPENSLRFHALRHFAASWMIENGLALPDVANLLGHKKFDLTLRTYTHAVMDSSHRTAAMERMSNRLIGSTGSTLLQPPVAQGLRKTV